LSNTFVSHDSPPSPCEGVSPTIDTNTDDLDDDTNKEEEEYVEGLKISFIFHKEMMKTIQFKDWHKQSCTMASMSTPCQDYFCYSICKPNMVGMTQASMFYSSE
jgi:hypothetical protein